jgi:hypothetical protein
LNCRQTRALLAIYRELQLNQTAMHALEEHLSQCTACQQAQALYDLTGERLRSLPEVEPLPDAYPRLMQALAREHTRFLQNAPTSPTVTPAPPFLAPYLKDLAQAAHVNKLAAFATAETGPIPVIQQATKRRPIYQINHFTIVGVAASFLMMLLVGSLTSLLLLNQHGSSVTTPSLVVHQLNDVRAVTYTAAPVYSHVASAVANGHTIYYTTYNDSETSWQLEQFDEQQDSNTPLLTKPSTQELIVLGSSPNWLVWLQIDPLKPTNPVSQATSSPPSQPPTDASTMRSWSLYAYYLGSAPSPATAPTPSPATVPTLADRELTSQTFDPSTVPSWIDRPIQGISFFQNTLLVAMIDAQGISHLQSYQLDPLKAITQTELATASKGHILASPTANSDGTAIYWADEYLASPSGQLSSDIWTQQIINNVTPPNADHEVIHPTTEQYAFRADGDSFHPQIVNDTLFLLCTSQTNGTTSHTANAPNAISSLQLATATPQASATVQPTVTPTTVNFATLPQGAITLDPTILPPQIDVLQTGRILSFTTSGVAETLPQFDNTQIVTALQGGTSFLLWQTADGSTFGMYDVIAKTPVGIGDNVFPPNAIFLAVNRDTAIAVTDQQNSITQGNQAQANMPVTFDTFRWPMPRS